MCVCVPAEVLDLFLDRMISIVERLNSSMLVIRVATVSGALSSDPYTSPSPPSRNPNLARAMPPFIRFSYARDATRPKHLIIKSKKNRKFDIKSLDLTVHSGNLTDRYVNSTCESIDY